MFKKTGGPAFPWNADRNDNGEVPGMTLRDYFAAKAMQSLILARNENGFNVFHFESIESILKSAYIYADELLAQREK